MIALGAGESGTTIPRNSTLRLARALRGAETLQRQRPARSARDWFVRLLGLSATESVAGAVMASLDGKWVERWANSCAASCPSLAPEEQCILTMGAELADVVEHAQRVAESLGDSHVGTEHALVSLAAAPDPEVAEFLTEHGLKADDLLDGLRRYRPTSGWRSRPQLDHDEAECLANSPCWDTAVIRALCTPGLDAPSGPTLRTGGAGHADRTYWRPGRESGRTRWSRWRTLRKLGGLFGAHTSRRAAFDLHLVGCDETETQHVLCLDEHVLTAAHEMVCSALGVPRRHMRLHALCIGSGVDRKILESSVAVRLDRAPPAFWLRAQCAAVLDVGALADAGCLLEALVHEATHGLLVLLPYPYHYPYVLQEALAVACGRACSVEHDVAALRGRPSIPWSRMRGQIAPDGYMSIHELVFHRGELPQDGRFHYASYALLVFLGIFNYVRCDPLLPLLIRTRRECPTCEQFYERLPQWLNTTPDGLESAFRLFCVDGKHPA